MEEKQGLFTKEFLLICFIFFFASAVMSVFFQFHRYLVSLNINPAWTGFIIAADSLASFILQPFLSVHLNSRNALKWLFSGIIGMAAMLLSYGFASNLSMLIAVRIMHGAAFVCLISAMLAIIIDYIPSQKSGQAFGFITIIRLVPYAIIPPVVNAIDKTPSDFERILMYSAALMIISFFLVFKLKSGLQTKLNTMHIKDNIDIRSLFDNIKNRNILIMFTVSLLLYSSYTIVFFFIKQYGHTRGVQNPGYFFTIATAAMIGVRLFSVLFDRINKAKLTIYCMAGLTVCFVFMAYIYELWMFFVLAFFTGFCWGIAMPLVYALIFDLSAPYFKSMNLILSLVTMQAGFFAGPFIGGFALNYFGYNALFYFCGFLCLLAAILLSLLDLNSGDHRPVLYINT